MKETGLCLSAMSMHTGWHGFFIQTDPALHTAFVAEMQRFLLADESRHILAVM